MRAASMISNIRNRFVILCQSLFLYAGVKSKAAKVCVRRVTYHQMREFCLMNANAKRLIGQQCTRYGVKPDFSTELKASNGRVTGDKRHTQKTDTFSNSKIAFVLRLALKWFWKHWIYRLNYRTHIARLKYSKFCSRFGLVCHLIDSFPIYLSHTYRWASSRFYSASSRFRLHRKLSSGAYTRAFFRSPTNIRFLSNLFCIWMQFMLLLNSNCMQNNRTDLLWYCVCDMSTIRLKRIAQCARVLNGIFTNCLPCFVPFSVSKHFSLKLANRQK